MRRRDREVKTQDQPGQPHGGESQQGTPRGSIQHASALAPREVRELEGLPATSLSTILHQSFFEQCSWGPPFPGMSNLSGVGVGGKSLQWPEPSVKNPRLALGGRAAVCDDGMCQGLVRWVPVTPGMKGCPAPVSPLWKGPSSPCQSLSALPTREKSSGPHPLLVGM